jgi:hypothetical protein
MMDLNLMDRGTLKGQKISPKRTWPLACPTLMSGTKSTPHMGLGLGLGTHMSLFITGPSSAFGHVFHP